MAFVTERCHSWLLCFIHPACRVCGSREAYRFGFILIPKHATSAVFERLRDVLYEVLRLVQQSSRESVTIRRARRDHSQLDGLFQPTWELYEATLCNNFSHTQMFVCRFWTCGYPLLCAGKFAGETFRPQAGLFSARSKFALLLSISSSNLRMLRAANSVVLQHHLRVGAVRLLARESLGSPCPHYLSLSSTTFCRLSFAIHKDSHQSIDHQVATIVHAPNRTHSDIDSNHIDYSKRRSRWRQHQPSGSKIS